MKTHNLPVGSLIPKASRHEKTRAQSLGQGATNDCTIALKTLASAAVVRAGEFVPLPKKCLALLSYLCNARGKPISRMDAALLLWPRDTDQMARHSFNQAIYTLRHRLGQSAILASEAAISVTSLVKADFLQLEDALERDDEEVILTLASGTFLMNLTIDDAPEFMDWRDRKSALLDRKLFAWLEAALELASQRLDARALERLARDGVTRFPNAPLFHKHLVVSRIAQGKRSEAATAYIELTAAATAALTISAIPTFDELVSLSTPIAHRAIPPRPVFVGRTRELQIATQLWHRAQCGDGGVLLVHGGTGIGKSTFINQCRQRVCDARAFNAAAYEAEHRVGYSLVSELLKSDLRSSDIATLRPALRESITQIVPSLAMHVLKTDQPRLSQEAGERRIFEAITRCLLEISAREPLMIVVDDLHWIDAASLGCLDHLIQRIKGERVLLIMTCRVGTSTPFGGYAHVNHVTLSTLDQNDTAQLVKALTGHRPTPTTLDRVFELTVGHPLFVTMIAERLAANQTIELPGVAEQFAHLSPLDWRLVSLLAVAGLPMTIRQLARIVGVAPARLLRRLRSIPGLSITQDDGAALFAHELIRASIYDELSVDTRRKCHKRLAEYYERSHANSGLAAQHWSRAGYPTHAATLALEAAADSESKHAIGAAAHFYELAMASMGEGDERSAIMAKLANHLVSAGLHEKAIPYLKQLAEQSNVANAIEWQWKELTCRLALQATDCDELLHDARELEKVADQCGYDEALYHSLRIQSVIEARRLADHSFVRERARLIELSNSRPETPIGALALRHVADHTSLTEDADKGLDYAKQACQWAAKLNQPELMINCLHSLALAEYCCGHVQESRHTLYEALELVEISGAVLYRSLILSTLSCALIELDASAEAAKCLHSIATGGSVRDEIDRLTADANRSVLWYHSGDYAECIAAADWMLKTNTSRSWLEISIRGVRGLAYLEIGRVQEATADADWLEAIVRSMGVLAGDISYPVMLIARVAAIRNRERRIEDLIRRKQSEYTKRDYVCRQRMKLAVAEVTVRRAPDEARMIAEAVADDAVSRHLVALHAQACKTARRARRKQGLRGTAI